MFGLGNRQDVRRKHHRPLGGRSRVGEARAAYETRLRIEPLEDRRLLSVFSVHEPKRRSGRAGGRSARHSATGDLRCQCQPGGDMITFDPSLNGTITLTAGKLDLTDTTGATTITGPGADQLTIDGDYTGSVFYIGTGTVNLSGLTITHGSGWGQAGGGIYNMSGHVSIDNCTISGNSAFTSGGGIWNDGSMSITNSIVSGNSGATLDEGGGIENDATLSIINSTISQNSCASDGGGVFNTGALSVVNCTFSGNSAGRGGAVYNNIGTATITSSTLAGNSASDSGGGVYQDDSFIIGSTLLSNSIVANNTSNGSPSDISGPVTANSSLIGNSTGASIIGGDGKNILDQDPLLGVLGNYGGPTQTIPPLAGSPAIDSGDNSLIPSGVTYDQRGAPL